MSNIELSESHDLKSKKLFKFFQPIFKKKKKNILITSIAFCQTLTNIVNHRQFIENLAHTMAHQITGYHVTNDIEMPSDQHKCK